VLSYLDFDELKVARLVCRGWEEESRVYISEKSKIVLDSEERLGSYMEEFIGERGFCDTIQIGPFMYLGTPLTDRFFQLYGLYLKHLILQKTQCSAAYLRNILFVWAPYLEELTIHGPTPGKSRFLDNDAQPIRPTLTSLKTVNLNLMITQGQSILRDFLFDLLFVSPNLERIVVPSKNVYKGFLPCLISTLLEHSDLPLDNLTEVDTLFSFGDGHIEMLMARKYPLESLKMQLMPNVTLDVLLPLLDSLNPTLKSLRLYFYLTRFKELPALLNLDNLEKLTLDTYQGSLRFTSHLPKLTELTITMKCMGDFEDAFPRQETAYDSWTCRSLKSFSSQVALVESCPETAIHKMHAAFPNLTSISVQGLSDMGARFIQKNYPNLEEWSAPGGLYTDVGITGLPSERLQLFCNSIDLSNPECIGNLCRQYTGNIVSLPSEHRVFFTGMILYSVLSSFNNVRFTELRKLHLDSHNLTDLTIFFGILHCRELKELVIERCDVSSTKTISYLGQSQIVNVCLLYNDQVTDKGIDAIINCLDIHRLHIMSCTRVSGPQLDLVRNKMKNRCLKVEFNEKRFSMYD